MKRLITIAALLWAANVNAADYVIGLPSSFPGDKQALYEAIGRFILFEMEPGNSLKVYDGRGLRELGRVSMPAKGAYRHAKVRKRRYLPVLKALKAHIVALPAEGESLDVIRFLDHLALHVVDGRLGGTPVQILLIGAAEHRDSRAPTFDMGQGQGLFPSDGHLRAGTGASVYGTADKQGRLEGFQVHWLHTTEPHAWENDLYASRISRFWHLWAKLQGGSLLTFTPDWNIAFERLQKSDLRPVRTYALDHTADKIEMLRARRTAVPTAPLSEGDAFLGDDVTIARQPPVRTAGYLKVGIRWECVRCDIDLYARAGQDAPFLYYGKVKTPQGRYNKDFQTSPDTSNGLEYVEFTAPVKLYEVEILINYYRGGFVAGGPKGSLRAFFDGRVYEVPFHIRSEAGNEGRDSSRALTSPHWDVIDLAAVLGLPRRPEISGGLGQPKRPRLPPLGGNT